MSSVLQTVPRGRRGQEAGLRAQAGAWLADFSPVASCVCSEREEGRLVDREGKRDGERESAGTKQGERGRARGPLEPCLEQSEHLNRFYKTTTEKKKTKKTNR